jgi:hypothetical protein
MVAADQGWEMAFYWSPIVWLAIHAVLALGGLAGLVGLVIGPGVSGRMQAAVAVLMCVGTFVVVPWG